MTVSDITKSKLKLVTIIVTLIAIPLMYVYLGTLLLNGSDPAEKLKNINASIVNLDQGITQDAEKVNIGEKIEKTLLESDKGFNWIKEDNLAKAKTNLENGNHKVVLTIPKDFTKNISNLPKNASTEPKMEHITLQTNDAINYNTGTIADTVSKVIQAEVRADITKKMSSKMLSSITKIKESLVKATDGTGQLSEATEKLNGGINKLKAGTDQLVNKIPDLTKGTSQLNDGANRLSLGSEKLEKGLQELSAKAPLIPENIGKINTNLKSLANNTQALSGSIAQLAQGISSVKDGLNSVNSSPNGNVNVLKDSIGAYTQGVDSIIANKEGLKQAGQGLQNITRLLDGTNQKITQTQQIIEEMCQTAPMAGSQTCTRLQATKLQPQELGALQTSSRQTEKIAQSLLQISEGFAKLEGKSAPLNQGITKIAGAVKQLNDASVKLENGATKLNQSAPKLNEGTNKLSQGANELYLSSQKLPLGIASAYQGSAQLNAGLHTLNNGTSKLNQGVSLLSGKVPQLTDGVNKLADGSGKINDGAHKLDESLTEGAEKIPSYDEATSQAIGTHIAKPIEAKIERIHPVMHSGIGTLPYYLSLGLWLLPLLVFSLIPALSRNENNQINLAKSLGLAGVVGIVEGLFVGIITNTLFGLSLANLGGFILVITLSTLAFTLVNQALIALFSRKGKAISILLLVLQMVATGLTYPMDIMPSFIQTISSWLPLTYTTEAIRIYTSNAGQSLAVHMTVLAITAFVGILGTILATKYASEKNKA